MRFRDHKHYVQGVAWDPRGDMLLSAAADRSVRVYGLKHFAGKKGQEKKTCAQRAKDLAARGVLRTRSVGLPAGAGAGADPAAPPAVRRAPLWHDDTACAFYRRLSWSPCGALAVATSGVLADAAPAAPRNASFLFCRHDMTQPAVALPGLGTPSVAARFCPVPFALPAPPAAGGARPLTDLPYRLVFAVASRDSVAVYDTVSPRPLAVACGLHLAEITDLSWSRDARLLAVSSRDGYCSVVSFDEGELGEPLAPEALPVEVRGAFLRPAAGGDAEDPAAPPTPRTPEAAPAASGGGPAADSAPASAEAGGKRRRIVPTAVAAPGAAAAPAGGLEGKNKRRVVPVPVGVAAAAAVAADSPAPAAPERRRITPVPVGAPAAEARPAAEATPAAEAKPAGAPKRITPVPVGAGGGAASPGAGPAAPAGASPAGPGRKRGRDESGGAGGDGGQGPGDSAPPGDGAGESIAAAALRAAMEAARGQ